MNPREQADAIQQDVATEEAALPTLTAPESPRMRALDAISSAHSKRMAEEMGVEQVEDEDETPADEQINAQLAEPELVAPEPPARTLKIKVDGVEEEVDLDTLTRTYQKNKAADRRLEEAAQILRAAQQQVAAAPTEPAPQAAPIESTDDLKAQAAELLDKLYDGDKDSASEALIKLLANRGGSSPTPQVQTVVDTEVLTSQVLERMQTLNAFERVKTDYPAIIDDPDLEILAANKVQRLVATGTSRADALLTAAEEVYQLIGKGRQETPPPKTQQRSQRQENKERLDPVPVASATAALPQSPAESSPSSVIAELALRRLGQSLPR